MSNSAERVAELLRIHRADGLSVTGWQELAECYRQLGKPDKAQSAEQEAAAQQLYLDQLPTGDPTLRWHFTCPSCNRVVATAGPQPLTFFTTCSDCGHRSLTGDFKPFQVPEPAAPSEAARPATPAHRPWAPAKKMALGFIVFFLVIHACSERDRAVVAASRPSAQDTLIAEASGWCQSMTSIFRMQGHPAASLEAVGDNGRLSHLRLKLPGPIAKLEAEQYGAEIGAAFYQVFPNHPTCINTFVISEPGDRTVKMVSYKRP